MQKYLVPKQGLIVRDPISMTPLSVDGSFVDWNGNAGRFWRRRVTQGDASILEGKKLEDHLKAIADRKAEQAAKLNQEKEEDPKTTSQSKKKEK